VERNTAHGRTIVRVTGTSMLPTLRAGDLVVVDPALEPRIGQIAVFRCGPRLVVHRVISRGIGRQMGDNTRRADRFDGGDVVGVVIAFQRDGSTFRLQTGRARIIGLALTARGVVRLAASRMVTRSNSSPSTTPISGGETSMTFENHDPESVELEKQVSYEPPTVTGIGTVADAVAITSSRTWD